MKSALVFAVSLAVPCALAQAAPPAQSANGAQGATYLPQHFLPVLCAHHHERGDAGSTILYRTKEVDSDALKGKIRVGRLTAIVVHFSHANTFCYTYSAGVTKETAFYGGSMPAVFKPFLGGGLPLINLGKDTSPQTKFSADYNAYSPLGNLAIQISKDFAACVKPEKVNSQIQTDVLAALKTDLKYTDRDVTKEDLVLRQTELQDGMAVLTKDLEKVREEGSAEASVIADDEKALAALNAQFANFATAIANLQLVVAAQDDIFQTVMLAPGFDEFELTAVVTPIIPNSPPNTQAVTPVSSSSTITVDVTGGSVLDFSLGIVATRPVSHDYYIGSVYNPVTKTTTSNVVLDGGATNPAIAPTAFVEYFTKPAPGQIVVGPAFGIDLSTGQNFCFGLAAIRGGAQRISVVGGFALNKITELNGDTVGQVAVNGKSVQTKNRFIGGYFFGLTFNFGG